MTFQQELNSWLFPSELEVAEPPSIGSKAPSTAELPFPNIEGKPTIITFLRHCGCPFAEKTFLYLHSIAKSHPSINFIAVSHSSQPATQTWLSSLSLPDQKDLTAGPVRIIVDPDRKLYGQWGLGVSNTWHILNPWSLYAVYNLGKSEGIWNRPTESGSRWQRSGSWAVSGDGKVIWGKAVDTADIIPDFDEAIEIIGSVGN